MDENIVQEILHELFCSLEALETQSGAILQLVKDKGLASEQEIRGYLEQAGNASNVKWRAAQVRIEHLIDGALKTAEREAKPEAAKQKASSSDEKSKESSASAGGDKSPAGQNDKQLSNMQQDASGEKSESERRDASKEKSDSRPASENLQDQAAKQSSEVPHENDRHNAA